MKKYLFLVAGVLTGTLLFGEDFNFVSTMSSPLGVFAKLETADAQSVTSVPKVNYCTVHADSGTLTALGKDSTYNANAQLGTLEVNGGLVGNATQWKASSVTVGSGGVLKVKRIMANTFDFNNTVGRLEVGTNMQAPALRAAVVKTGKVIVNNKTWFNDTSTYGIASMQWRQPDAKKESVVGQNTKTVLVLSGTVGSIAGNITNNAASSAANSGIDLSQYQQHPGDYGDPTQQVSPGYDKPGKTVFAP